MAGAGDALYSTDLNNLFIATLKYFISYSPHKPAYSVGECPIYSESASWGEGVCYVTG